MDPRIVFFTGIFLMLWMSAAETTGTASRQYHFVNIPKTWSDAQHHCRLSYADLATVDNMEEHKRLVESVGDADASSIWIGLERSQREWWIWSEGIGEVTVFTWNIGKEYGNCVMMLRSIYWYAKDCSQQAAFLCFEYDSEGKETYSLQTTLMTWRDAQSFCRKHHTDLVSVKTKAQNEDIFNNAEDNEIWIGLAREDWMWSDRSNTSFRNWRKNPSDNHENAENCTVMSKSDQYQWNDDNCDRRYPFVCYGDQKLKSTVVKVKINSKVNLNRPTESESLLQQIQARLEAQGVTEVKIRWHAGESEQIFKQDKDNGDTKSALSEL